jgi:hypothetical protein
MLFKEYLLNNWILTQKVVLAHEISDDQLTSTIFMEFINDTVKQEWLSDPIVTNYVETLKMYNAVHNISVEKIIS